MVRVPVVTLGKRDVREIKGEKWARKGHQVSEKWLLAKTQGKGAIMATVDTCLELSFRGAGNFYYP